MNLPRLMIQFGIPGITLLFLFFELILPFLLKHRPRGQVRRRAAKAYVFTLTFMFLSTYSEVVSEPIHYQIPGVFGEGMFFQVDPVNFPLLILTGVLWLLIGSFSREDIHYLFYTMVYLSTIGTLLAGDLLTFFLFFEIMTFASYALMVYHRGEESLEAGAVYIYMGIIGGLLVLAGLLLLVAYTGQLQWDAVGEAVREMRWINYLIAFFLLTGFSVKAALMPFHFWMPRVYPGAPFAVIALSSGLLIKVGIYGMIHLFSVSTLLPSLFFQRVGFVLLWLGLLSMSFGALAALMQSHVKRLLAYSSISQIGYIVTGLGLGFYLGNEGIWGFAGSFFHLLNHSLYKVLWILVAATVYFSTKETNMYKMGNLYRKMPLTFFFGLIAFMGMTGMPGFNGYASKTVLYQGLTEASETGHASLTYAGLLFKAASAGTVAYAAKFLYHVFLKSFSVSLKEKPAYPQWMNFSMGILSLFILLIGLFPHQLMTWVLIPASQHLAFDPSMTDIKITGMNFWQWKNLSSSLLAYSTGLLLLFAGVRFHLFQKNLPPWASAEKFLYRPMITACDRFATYCVQKYEAPIIFGDALIYAILLFCVMFVLIVRSLLGFSG
ncbi:complex I subunit 5 family protein [Tindallia californiensis]|uniref:Formate hydrogenlyase subunit 3/Multisubunit Na+/H+ antiporter, MnhD subunit n=1 Tax=Tindallia californiensis TaxID=159292 RepID=A0A1H3PZ55_9FIRM|nr:complex I subunit 5 family protein [Tindallia californiensis]SDZ05699.1 Formate hydrogenlyase subunit 3/Multisubunit Na+/H+ antiporter, MnhD subunit [Tindallia californiensis]